MTIENGRGTYLVLWQLAWKVQKVQLRHVPNNREPVPVPYQNQRVEHSFAVEAHEPLDLVVGHALLEEMAYESDWHVVPKRGFL